MLIIWCCWWIWWWWLFQIKYINVHAILIIAFYLWYMIWYDHSIIFTYHFPYICYIAMFVVQFLRHSVLTVAFINNRMVMMLSIGPVALRIGMWLSFSSWREQIPMLWIRWLYCEITLIIYIYLAILIIDYVFYIVIIVIHVIHFTWMTKYLTLKSDLGSWYSSSPHH